MLIFAFNQSNRRYLSSDSITSPINDIAESFRKDIIFNHLSFKHDKLTLPHAVVFIHALGVIYKYFNLIKNLSF